MFDTIQLGPRSVNVRENRTVTEKRAPTDESVRLLVDVVQIRSNKLDGKCFIFENHPTNTLRVRLVFKFNDEKLDWTVDVDRFKGPKERLDFLHEEVSKMIAGHLLGVFAPEFAESILKR